MTDFKRRTLFLSTGKQIKLFGNSMAIGKSLEIGEGYAPNIFSSMEQAADEKTFGELPGKVEEIKKTRGRKSGKTMTTVCNPHRLTPDEVLEMADYNIRLWMELKDNVRAWGVSNPRIFNGDAIK